MEHALGCVALGKGAALGPLQPVCHGNHSADRGLSREHSAGCCAQRDKNRGDVQRETKARQVRPKEAGGVGRTRITYPALYLGKAKALICCICFYKPASSGIELALKIQHGREK